MKAYPKFDGVVCRSSSYKVFIFVEITWKDFICVGMNFLHILTTSCIPYSQWLISTATCKNAFMGRMPNCLIHNKIMHICAFTTRHLVDVPHLDTSIIRCTQNLPFINMIPFAPKHLTLMLLKYSRRCIAE